MPFFFDAHSHLPESDSPAAVADRRVVCGTCESDWGAVLAHAEGDRRVVPMLGLHPWFVAEASPNWALRLEGLLRSHPVGVGECGLDFARKAADRAGQTEALRLQLRLAHALQRPVALHVVQAWGPLVSLLREEGIPPAGALVHAYSGSPELARDLQAEGVFLSYSGGILDPGRERMREALLATDSDYLLVESDGAADLAAVLQAAAHLRGATVADLTALTWENGRRCFKELLA